MEKRSTITTREDGKQKTMITGSKHKPEIVSSVIQKWQSLIDVTVKVVGVFSGLILKLNNDTIEVCVKSNTEVIHYENGEEAKFISKLYSETVLVTQKHLLVPDVTKSKVWKEINPTVDINLISYLGLPINWPDGEAFGTVCLLDKKKNSFNQRYIDLLDQVKTQIETDLQLLVANIEIAEQKKELKYTGKPNETLRDTNNQFQIVFENSQAVMLLIDPESHQIVAANKAAENFYGWKRSEIETMCIDDINTLSSTEIDTEMEKVRKKERIYLKFKHRRAFGDIRDVEVYSGKVEIDGKEYLHSIIHDISEHNRVESELRHSEQRFRMVFESANVGKSITLPSGEIEVNKAFCDMLGYSREELQNKKWQEITPQEEVIEIEKRLQPIMAGLTESSRIEKRYIHKNGLHVWADVSVRLMRDSENKPLYFITTVTDISKQKLAEEELRQSEERFKALHNASFGGIVIHDNGILVDCNHGLTDLTGYSGEELTGKNVLDLIAKYHRDFVNEKMLSGFERPYEVVGLHKSGNEFPVRIEARNIPYKGKTVRVVEFRDISEQKKAVEEQTRSLNLLDNLAKQVPGVVYQYRLYPDGRSAFPYSSPGMWDIYEVTPEEVQEDASPVFTRIHPDDYDYIVETITESAKNQTNYESEFRVILPKQGLRWRHSNAKPELLEDGSTLWHGIITDITDRKKAEEALSHSHDLMKYIIEHNQSSVAVLDKNLKYLFVSQRYLGDYRVKEMSIIGKHHYEVFPDIPEKWRKVHQKALEGIVSQADEDVFYRKDGTFEWTRWACRPWYEANGSIGGIILYLEVISEQKRKEEEIRKLNHRLEILIDSIQQLTVAHSLDTVQEIVATSARKLIGADWATLVLREGDNSAYVNENVTQPLWKGKIYPINTCISRWVMENKEPVVIEDVTSDERIPQAICSSNFIKSLAMVPVNISGPIGAIGHYWKEKYTPTETELQLMQTLADASGRAIENINLYAELEERVKQRTAQLQSVNKELETFTYSVSHDLKAPLRGIDGYSKLLLDEYGSVLNEEATHFIKDIRSSTLQMNRLIEDLLSYSRLERRHFKQEKIALKSFVEILISNFSAEIMNKHFEIDIKIPEVEIMAVSTGLSIALRNFIENAIKFSDEQKSPYIHIGYDENPEAWKIYVKDNGVGFDMKYHNRIFEIFQRLHRSEDFPGTGIGLAMVAKAMQRMGGKAWAESKPGEGATFFIEIPKK